MPAPEQPGEPPDASLPDPPRRADRLREVWQRANPYVGLGAFFGGFLWDALTLVRVDRLFDNLYLAACLLLLGAALIVEHRAQAQPERRPWLTARVSWVSYLAQFLFGSLFSAYVVFYFRSAATAWHLLFVLLLAGAMVFNEFLHGYLRAERLRVLLFGFSTFSFLMFFIPVVTGWLGASLFFVAALLTFALSGLLVLLMHAGLSEQGPRGALYRHAASLAALLAALGLAESTGVIPPIPVAVLDQGIFHKVEVRQQPDPSDDRRPSRYLLSYEHRGPISWFQRHDAVFHLQPGDRAHYFTAIFTPSGTVLDVVHHWQRWDAAQGWLTTDRIDVSTRHGVTGGAATGFRTWSAKQRLTPGPWRVIAETKTGRVLSVQAFEVVPAAPGAVELVERAYD